MVYVDISSERITCCGHAGTGYHPDPVCEALTCLCSTLVASIEELFPEVTPKYELLKGYFLFNRVGLPEEAKILVEAFIIGVRCLADGYPQNVGVTVR